MALTPSEKAVKFRIKRRSFGLCDCGKPLDVNDKNRCETCKEKSNIERKLRKENRKLDKKCSECGNSNDSKWSLCQKCRDKSQSFTQKLKMQQNIKNGLCARCGIINTNNKQLCHDCHKQKTKRYRNFKKSRIDNGLCLSCGNLRENLNTCECEKCKQIQKDKTQSFKLEVLKNYGGKCTCCGETEEAFLCIDHINNDGGKHRRETGLTGRRMYRWLIKNNYPKDNFQILCWNCNLAKFHKGICPHKKLPNN